MFVIYHVLIYKTTEGLFQERNFFKSYDSALMAMCFVFIKSFPKVFFNEKRLTLKIDNAASTEIHGKYIT